MLPYHHRLGDISTWSGQALRVTEGFFCSLGKYIIFYCFTQLSELLAAASRPAPILRDDKTPKGRGSFSCVKTSHPVYLQKPSTVERVVYPNADAPRARGKRKAMRTQKTIEEFRKKVENLYGNRLKDIILYGSWARGESTAKSDIDLAVVLQGWVSPGKEIDRMIDIITDINLKYSELVSVYPVSEENYATLNSPLLINVRREGISV